VYFLKTISIKGTLVEVNSATTPTPAADAPRGVHMERVWVRRAAVNICCRLVEGAVVIREGEGEDKKNKGEELELE
jgi:hypothetical protein